MFNKMILNIARMRQALGFGENAAGWSVFCAS